MRCFKNRSIKNSVHKMQYRMSNSELIDKNKQDG